jgi:hypothetical protein
MSRLSLERQVSSCGPGPLHPSMPYHSEWQAGQVRSPPQAVSAKAGPRRDAPMRSIARGAPLAAAAPLPKEPPTGL